MYKFQIAETEMYQEGMCMLLYSRKQQNRYIRALQHMQNTIKC